ncbi:unnamed protein product [Sphagnum jensenii]|uniref:NADH:ubiquinone oxidoreductase intermediate-associated protein 30 domain-containing protein n=1 Tax=Sphagnum jensenii TaxID=128206 RepID=A0ABP0VS36_9BRYO
MLRALLQSSIAATHSIAWNLKDLIPATECDLFKFATAADLIQWEVYSDAENGGMTTASFQSNVDLGTDMLQCELNIMNSVRCNLSVELMEHANTRMRRSGFSGIRTVQDINTIVMRVKENWMGAPGATDPNTWQAFVFAPQDEWSVIKIPLARYLPTWKGKIVESDAEMNAACVTGMGLSLTAEGGPEGGEEGPGPSVWN